VVHNEAIHLQEKKGARQQILSTKANFGIAQLLLEVVVGSHVKSK